MKPRSIVCHLRAAGVSRCSMYLCTSSELNCRQLKISRNTYPNSNVWIEMCEVSICCVTLHPSHARIGPEYRSACASPIGFRPMITHRSSANFVISGALETNPLSTPNRSPTRCGPNGRDSGLGGSFTTESYGFDKFTLF